MLTPERKTGTGEMLKDRVTARLDELGITPSEAARRGELERTFLVDILHERKKGVRGANLEKLARALECSPEYLSGRDEAPGRAPRRGAGLAFAGLVADGVYRTQEIDDETIAVPFYPDYRFDACDQQVMRLTQDCGERYGIAPGSYIFVIDIETFRAKYGGLRDGMIAVTQTERDGLTMRRLNRVGLSEDGIRLDRNDAEGEAISAVVICAFKSFV